MNACRDVSPTLYNMTISNIIIAHLVFDSIVIVMIPRLFRKYQWL